MAAPLQLDTKSSSVADTGGAFGFDNSHWTVNVGGKGGVATGQAVPTWVLIAALALGAAWLLKRKH